MGNCACQEYPPDALEILVESEEFVGPFGLVATFEEPRNGRWYERGPATQTSYASGRKASDPKAVRKGIPYQTPERPLIHRLTGVASTAERA